MKKILVFATIVLGAGASLAAEINCDINKKKSAYAVKVASDEAVTVSGLETGSSGFRWISEDDVPSVYVAPAHDQPGAYGTREFTIDTRHQTSKSKKYVFNHRRPWEPVSKTAARCSVTVIKN